MSRPSPRRFGSLDRFALPARALHWAMAILIIAMLLIGVGMVSTAGPLYSELLSFHRPIGIGILALVVVRLVVRLTHRAPALPADLPPLIAAGARASHYALYCLMFALPIVGWAMLSAAGFPITLWPGVTLFPILPHDLIVYGWLRYIHGVLGYCFFAVIVLHFSAALFHALVRRDNVLKSMIG